MDAQQIKLYQRIQEFALDEADVAFPLSRRLAKENCWTAQYTQRVMNEFKKFMFLAVVAGHPVTPSEQVDQVWHSYLTYTHSYWNEFCAKVLQKPLHHNPTRGGISEYQKFDKWYTNTLISYQRFFDQPPPSDIWSQIVAAKLNSAELQVWHCSCCYSQVDKKTVHSYIIENYKNYHTKNCPNCRERTMRITYETHDQATQWSEVYPVHTAKCSVQQTNLPTGKYFRTSWL